MRRPERRAPRRRARRRAARDVERGRTAIDIGTRSRVLVLATGVSVALALSLAFLPSALAGGGNDARLAAAHARAGSQSRAQAHRTLAGAGATGPVSRTLVSRTLEDGPPGTCQPAGWPSGYVNPLAHARVTPERIDQGVDYAGSGTLTAIGAARVTYVATTGTGWPGGTFIEYRLLEGPDAGCFVYYAEGVKPAPGVRVGKTMHAGRPIARIVSGSETGIEVGWGSGISTSSYAAKAHQWSTNGDRGSIATAAGRSFSTLIAVLGGPPGKVEG